MEDHVGTPVGIAFAHGCNCISGVVLRATLCTGEDWLDGARHDSPSPTGLSSDDGRSVLDVRTSFHHDHAVYNRTEKIERIAESDYAVSKLKVCYADGTFRNCSRCNKCHRTLM